MDIMGFSTKNFSKVKASLTNNKDFKVAQDSKWTINKLKKQKKTIFD